MATQSRAAGEGEETGWPGAHAPAVEHRVGPTAPWRHAETGVDAEPAGQPHTHARLEPAPGNQARAVPLARGPGTPTFLVASRPSATVRSWARLRVWGAARTSLRRASSP